MNTDRMPSQELNGRRRIVKVDTSRVGVDGLRELLVARYGVRALQGGSGATGQRGGGSSENTRR